MQGKPIIWEFDVKDLLQEGENELQVIFHSPLKYIAEAYKKYGNIGNDDTYEGFMHLRKAHYMFGWDWGAHLPDAGIFRPVSLLLLQRHKAGLHLLPPVVRPYGRKKAECKDQAKQGYKYNRTDRACKTPSVYADFQE